ncbi:MAG TPA: MerR family transcriptional regulator [Sediminibacterium sp.]|nr:MerR family transcriptional regulator [Sediminibacterium sp.]
MATILQQLDLFGMPMDLTPLPKKKKQAAPKKAAAVTVVAEPVAEIPLPVNDAVVNEEPVVYANEQIVVKLKPKAAPAVIEPSLREPVTRDPSIRESSVRESVIKPESKRGRKSFKEIDASADLIDIPEDQVLQQKLYYSISEVAGWFKVNTSLLRYWENEFDILQPRKTRKGDRLFRIEDIKNLQLIYFLLRQRKFSIEGAKNYLKNNKQKIDTETQLVQTLKGFRTFLLELRSSLGN